jgi:SAM-dependent methyltransferase
LDRDKLLSEVAGYYASKLAAHGQTPQGVDWNGEASQVLRFEQLARIIAEPDFVLADVGCGYGAMLEYLRARFPGMRYIGCDISEEMVQAARARHGDSPQARFVVSAQPPDPVDYCIASGIFNVRLGRGDDEWFQYLTEMLDVMDRASARGFAFNCLTSYSDPERMRDSLYYADPCRLFDFCKRRYARNVALLHDYGLYEFTMLVRKTT